MIMYHDGLETSKIIKQLQTANGELMEALKTIERNTIHANTRLLASTAIAKALSANEGAK